jgi:hypothetical protein
MVRTPGAYSLRSVSRKPDQLQHPNPYRNRPGRSLQGTSITFTSTFVALPRSITFYETTEFGEIVTTFMRGLATYEE